jgi:hypothetical protein
MSEIYREAGRVVAWLGKGTEKSRSCTGQLMEAVWTTRLSQVNSYFEWKSKHGDGPKISLACLFQQPYWSRLWIVQEFALANDMTIVWGRQQMNWDDLLLVA